MMVGGMERKTVFSLNLVGFGHCFTRSIPRTSTGIFPSSASLTGNMCVVGETLYMY